MAVAADERRDSQARYQAMMQLGEEGDVELAALMKQVIRYSADHRVRAAAVLGMSLLYDAERMAAFERGLPPEERARLVEAFEQARWLSEVRWEGKPWLGMVAEGPSRDPAGHGPSVLRSEGLRPHGPAMRDPGIAGETAGQRGVEGWVVSYVFPGTPAEAIGLKVGDVVIVVEDQPVRGFRHLAEALGRRSAGDPVTLTVARDGVVSRLACVMTTWSRPLGSDPPVRSPGS